MHCMHSLHVRNVKRLQSETCPERVWLGACRCLPAWLPQVAACSLDVDGTPHPALILTHHTQGGAPSSVPAPGLDAASLEVDAASLEALPVGVTMVEVWPAGGIDAPAARHAPEQQQRQLQLGAILFQNAYARGHTHTHTVRARRQAKHVRACIFMLCTNLSPYPSLSLKRTCACRLSFWCVFYGMSIHHGPSRHAPWLLWPLPPPLPLPRRVCSKVPVASPPPAAQRPAARPWPAPTSCTSSSCMSRRRLTGCCRWSRQGRCVPWGSLKGESASCGLLAPDVSAALQCT